MRFDDTFANGKYIDGADRFTIRWAQRSAELRDTLGARACLGMPYGSGARHWFDLFLPQSEPIGLMVFIHGGYWLDFGPRDFSHLASGALARGWACTMPAYTLAPTVRITTIVNEITAAIVAMSAEISGPIVLTGHSAGGHLAARMASADIDLPDGVVSRIARVLPISPLSDLRPLIETSMNTALCLDPTEALAQSPALLPRRPRTPVRVWVGGAERPAFLDQARRLGNAWACPVTIEPERHHFDVIEGLESADSPLMTALLG